MYSMTSVWERDLISAKCRESLGANVEGPDEVQRRLMYALFHESLTTERARIRIHSRH